ncbi:Retron-type RNA-directed DNA polymerase, partial [hydrothermal vent metagenome]
EAIVMIVGRFLLLQNLHFRHPWRSAKAWPYSAGGNVTTVKREDCLSKAKSFEIPKRLIWEAWKRVAANKGVPGVDKESIMSYQTHLGDKLFVLWNRMSSGSYHPKAVKQVLIPKGDGSDRSLGIPTVTDRIAQTAVKMVLEPRLEAVFHYLRSMINQLPAD